VWPLLWFISFSSEVFCLVWLLAGSFILLSADVWGACGASLGCRTCLLEPRTWVQVSWPLFWAARSVYESRRLSSWLLLVELRLLWVFYTCCPVYPCAIFRFCGGFYCFSCGGYCCSLLGGLAVSFCGAFAVSTYGVLVVAVSAVDSILFLSSIP